MRPGMFPMAPPSGMPPGMYPPGMPPGMPPPWAMPPWMQPQMVDMNGYPMYDPHEAERQLEMAEMRAKAEERRSANQVWEDHPARRGRRSPKRANSKSRS